MAKPKKPVSNKPGQGSNSKTGGAAAATPKGPASKANAIKDAIKSDAKPASAPPKTDTNLSKVEMAVNKAQTASTSSATAKPADTKPADAKTSQPPKTPETKVDSKSKTPAKPAQTSDAKPATTQTKPEAKAKPEPAKAPEKPVEAAKPKPTPPTPAPAPTPAPEKRSGGFVPLALGGLVAGAIGFFAAEMNAFGMRDTTDNTEALRSTLAEQEQRIEALNTTISEMSTPDLSPLEQGLGALAETVGALDTRLTTIEDRPVVTSTGEIDVEAYDNEFAALAASVEEQKAGLAATIEAQQEQLNQLLENAQSVEQATAEAARMAVVQGALTEMTTAISEGAPFAAAIETLQANGVDDIPAPLTDAAADGVPTLTTLQTGFADAARNALGSARAAGAQEGESGLGGFLKRSLGARSVEPREGSDPDAVLSRVEVAVRNGAISDALTEIDTLPAASQDAMGPWLSDARTRAAVRTAAQDLSERLTAN